MSNIINPIGPEPPGVYWRRRLLVALGAILILIFIWWLISPSGDNKPVAVSVPTDSASPSPTASDTSSPSPSASASTDCIDSDITVTVSMDKSSYSKGTTIPFFMTIANKGATACNRNVGPKVDTFNVSSGGVPAWSSDDCKPAGGDQIVSIPAGSAFKVESKWEQNVTAAGCSNAPAAQPGSYQVVGTNLATKSSKLIFVINP